MAQTYNTQLPNITIQFINALKVKATKTYLKESLQSHPYFPSLYSISDVLSKLNIENIATQIKTEQLDDLEPPFITYLSHLSVGKDFVLVTKITDAEVEYVYEGKKIIRDSRDYFIKRWNNIVLLAEAGAESGQHDYISSQKAEKRKAMVNQLLMAASLSVFLLVAGLFLWQVADISVIAASLLLFTKTLGTAIAILLLMFETDKTNPFINNICTAGTKTNCDAILSSKASKIWGISWSEAGFFYFASSLLFLLFPGLVFEIKLPWLAIAATLVAPYIIFSIWYQYKIIKQWCPLCLATQAVIATELIMSILFYWISPKMLLFNILILSVFLIVILIPIAVWYFLKSIFFNNKNSNIHQYAYKRILYNPDYFNALLQKQPLVSDGWQHLGIDIGNPYAENTILKVCNPYCGPCAKAHPILEEFISSNRDYKLKIIFSIDDIHLDPAKHLLAIAENSDEKTTLKALNDWYMAPKRIYELFAAKYPLTDIIELQMVKINQMTDWCKNADITFTPSIFINGRPLPVDYRIEEIRNIL